MATAYLSGRRWLRGRGRAVLAALLIGSLLPDMIDKSLMLVGTTPYGRSIGHSLLFFALLCLIALVFRARRAAARDVVAALAFGVCTHLIFDLLADLESGMLLSGRTFSAWFAWPWWTPDDAVVFVEPCLAHRTSLRRMPVTVLEIVSVVVAYLVVHRDLASGRLTGEALSTKAGARADDDV